MNIDQKIVLIYSLIGIASGFLSDFLSKLSLGFSIPIAIYIVSFVFLKRMEKSKKTMWLFYNTFLAFVLVWLTTWIFLFNM